MKLLAVTASNFLGAPRKEITFTAPVVVIAGPNGAGKSSLIEAIRFCLGKTIPRGVTLKKDYDKLLTHGAKKGTVKVTLDHQGLVTDMVRKVDGAQLIMGEELDQDAELLAFLLDAHHFHTMPEKDRRSFVFKLLKIPMSWPIVRTELIEQGLDDGPVLEEIGFYIRNGFAPALEQVQKRLGDARTAWCQITGAPRYGRNIAADWVAPGSEVDTADLFDTTPLKQKLDEAKRALQVAQLEQANLKNKAEAREKVQTQLADDPGVEACKQAVIDAQAAVDKLDIDIAAARKAADTQGGTTGACPHCAGKIRFDLGAFLVATDDPPGGPKEHAALTRLTAQRAGYLQAVGEAARTEARWEGLRNSLPAEVTKKMIKAADDAAKLAQKDVDAATADLAAAGAGMEAVEEAKRITADASKKNEEITQLELAEALLKPEGVQTTLLIRGLKPLNVELDRISREIGWDVPRLDADFTTVVGPTEYQGLSESEKWRADTVVACAIAKISGLRFLLVDRFDVLDNDGLNDFLGWLGSAGAEEFDTVIAAGTMKKKPVALTETFGAQVLWFTGASAVPTEEGEPA